MSEPKRYAQIDGDTVQNVALWQDDPGEGWALLPDDSPVGPGHVRDGDGWRRPDLPAQAADPAQERARALREQAQAATSVAALRAVVVGLLDAQAGDPA